MTRLVILISGLLLLPQIGVPQSSTARKPPVRVPSDSTFFNGKWYRLYLEEGNWERARHRCTSLGGQLVIVPDAPTWAFLRPMTKGLSLWLGATDEKTEGLWVWIDGTPMTFKAWQRRQPDDLHRKQNHLRTTNNGWDDLEKSAKTVGFICEWKDQ